MSKLPTFLAKVEQYVDAVVRRDINVESTYKYVVEKENQKAVDLAMAEVIWQLELNLFQKWSINFFYPKDTRPKSADVLQKINRDS